MATSAQKPPKALVYSSNSALLVVGSTASCSCTEDEDASRPVLVNSDRDAEKIYETFVRDASFIKDSQSELILSSSNNCCREGVLDAIKQQASKAQGEDGLFVFVYAGRACDKWDRQVGLEISEEEDGLIAVSPDPSVERFSLVLNQYNCKSSEMSLSGDAIGKAIFKGGMPSQVYLILECPHAGNISSCIKQSLSGCACLEYIVEPIGKQIPCYIHTLNCSALTFFFNLFVKKTEFVTGMFPIRRVLEKVTKCCTALSSLDMVADGEWVKAKRIVPEAQFMRIPERAEREFNSKENEDDTDEPDAPLEFQSLIDTLKRLFSRQTFLKPCADAVRWVRSVTETHILALKEEGVLEGPVLEAVVGSLVFSLVTIQIAVEGPITSSVFFTQAYMLAIAAIDFVNPGYHELGKNALVAIAAEYYLRANKECSGQDRKTVEDALKDLKANP